MKVMFVYDWSEELKCWIPKLGNEKFTDILIQFCLSELESNSQIDYWQNIINTEEYYTGYAFYLEIKEDFVLLNFMYGQEDDWLLIKKNELLIFLEKYKFTLSKLKKQYSKPEALCINIELFGKVALTQFNTY